MSAPHYGDSPMDPQDAARAYREEYAPHRAITAEQAVDYHDPGIPLPAFPPTPLDLIRQFCSTDESRTSLLRPWNANGYTWASDGRIAAQIPQHPDVINDDAIQYPDIMALWNDATKSIPAVADLPKLPADAGQLTACQTCEGSGVYTCPACDATHKCADCAETGETRDPRWMRIGGKGFRLYQLAQIAKLPGVRAGVMNNGYLYFASGVITGLLSNFHANEDSPHEWKGDES